MARQGIIIECPLNGLFHDAHDVILSSWMGGSEMADNVNDNEPPLVAMKCRHFNENVDK